MTGACGTRKGYLRHRSRGEEPCGPCGEAHRRYCKEYRHKTAARSFNLSVDAAEAVAILNHANSLGISDHRFTVMCGLPAGFATRTRRTAATVHPSSMERLRSGIVDLQIPDVANIDADLTHWRVRSLMRQQWSRAWIGEQVGWTPGTRWWTYKKVRACHARDIRDLAASVGDRRGLAVITGRNAERAGWLPLAAWDDPGTLVWPAGYPRPALRPKADISFDEVAVVRRMAGDRTVRVRRRESEEVVRRLVAEGHSLRWIEQRTGLRTHRYVHVLDRQEGAA